MAYEINNSNRPWNTTRSANVNNSVNATNQPNLSESANAEGGVGDAPILQPRILIADDQPDVLEALRALLKNHGYKCELASSPAAIIEAITAREFDLILMDLNYARDTTSGREGLDVLARVRQSANEASIVVMTGWATVNLAVDVMQRGVAYFIEKPWSNVKLLEVLRQQIELGRERRKAREQDAGESREHDKIKSTLARQERELEET